MSEETSALLGLPYIQAAQAQKHVTHNEALRKLDVLVQATAIARDRNTPPAGPAEGDRYVLGAAPTGDWAGQAQALALFETGVWQFFTPQTGWRVYIIEQGVTAMFNGTAWTTAQAPTELGINTAADDTNRLAVASDAVLFTHDGAGHQLKINKASASDTASLLFQSNWQGRAEMGLAGNNDFSIKVSDGTSWFDAMRFGNATGHVTGTAVQATATDTTPGRLARADYAYGPGNLLGTVSQNAGVPTGAVIESGSNANGNYVRFADGTQICTSSVFSTVAGTSSVWTFPASFTYPASPGRLSISGTVSSTTSQSAVLNVGGLASGNNINVWATRLSNGTIVAANANLTAVGRWF